MPKCITPLTRDLPLALLLLLSTAPTLCAATNAELKKERLFEHFLFKIDAKTPLQDLLPPPPSSASNPILPGDLSQVPEVQMQQPRTIAVPLDLAKLPAKEQERIANETRQALIANAHLIARINFVNQKKNDRYMELLLENRSDLAGLPFTMGDACRLQKKERAQFTQEVDLVRTWLRPNPAEKSERRPEQFWAEFDSFQKSRTIPKGSEFRSSMSALMQIFGPETIYQTGVVERMPVLERTEADRKMTTEVLARLAVFGQHAQVRRAAVKALKDRDFAQAEPILRQGLRYPWPAIAQNAADALVQLKRIDFIPELVKMLEEPDPRAPSQGEMQGKKVTMVREVVRINHHRNCLLCHPPGNTPDVMTVSKIEAGPAKDSSGLELEWVSAFTNEGMLVGAVPTPGEPLPDNSSGYSRFATPDILVRADVTYLRQDFSLLQKVDNAHPWPQMQRFDYLVRNRALSEKEAKAYQTALTQQTASPYRQTALAALSRLTGRDADGTAQEWRSSLRLP